MTELLQNASILTQGLVIALLGLLLVFAVLVLFFLSIRILGRVREKKSSDTSGPSAT